MGVTARRRVIIIFSVVNLVAVAVSSGISVGDWFRIKKRNPYEIPFGLLQMFLNLIAAGSILMAIKKVAEPFIAISYISLWMVAQDVSSIVCPIPIQQIPSLGMMLYIQMGWTAWTVMGTALVYRFCIELQNSPGYKKDNGLYTVDNLKWRPRAKIVAIVDTVLTIIHIVTSIIIAATVLLWRKFAFAKYKKSFLSETWLGLESKWLILALTHIGICLVNSVALWRLWRACKLECIKQNASAQAKRWTAVRIVYAVYFIISLTFLFPSLSAGLVWLVAVGHCWTVGSTVVVIIFTFEVESSIVPQT